MKQQHLKKVLFFSMLYCVLATSVEAQMLDLMGSTGIGAAQTVQSVKSVGHMNRALQNTQFLNELQLKIADITTTYFGNYRNMPTRTVNIGKTKIVFQQIEAGQYYEAHISPVDQNLCETLLHAHIDNAVGYRLIDNTGNTEKYTPAQVQSSTGMCVAKNAVVLILQ